MNGCQKNSLDFCLAESICHQDSDQRDTEYLVNRKKTAAERAFRFPEKSLFNLRDDPHWESGAQESCSKVRSERRGRFNTYYQEVYHDIRHLYTDDFMVTLKIMTTCSYSPLHLFLTIPGLLSHPSKSSAGQ
jgi:hypothetical protein